MGEPEEKGEPEGRLLGKVAISLVPLIGTMLTGRRKQGNLGGGFGPVIIWRVRVEARPASSFLTPPPEHR